VHAVHRESTDMTVDTPVGAARVHLTVGKRGLLCLGHGAGGGFGAPDLVAVARAAIEAGWSVALVEQPYRVAGRRAPDRAPKLDVAWEAAVAAVCGLPALARRRQPLVCGGRSSGARVACRTAAATGADAVVCLAFPLHPPARPGQSRADELAAVGVPLLVVQGDRDPFGRPDELPAVGEVIAVAGDHSLRRSATEAAAAVAGWLAGQRVA
jgi:uncharacterized protein